MSLAVFCDDCYGMTDEFRIAEHGNIACARCGNILIWNFPDKKTNENKQRRIALAKAIWGLP